MIPGIDVHINLTFHGVVHICLPLISYLSSPYLSSLPNYWESHSKFSFHQSWFTSLSLASSVTLVMFCVCAVCPCCPVRAPVFIISFSNLLSVLVLYLFPLFSCLRFSVLSISSLMALPTHNYNRLVSFLYFTPFPKIVSNSHLLVSFSIILSISTQSCLKSFPIFTTFDHFVSLYPVCLSSSLCPSGPSVSLCGLVLSSYLSSAMSCYSASASSGSQVL